MVDIKLTEWLREVFGVDEKIVLEALKNSPSAQGYIHGAISEVLLAKMLSSLGYDVYRIKEKPSGGFKEKKVGYKGDFLIKKYGCDDYYVVECKGLKTNSEFRSAQTLDSHSKKLTKKQAYNILKAFIDVDNKQIFAKGFDKYQKIKKEWENKHPEKIFPSFNWNIDFPGPDNVDLTSYFSTRDALKLFIDKSDESLLFENSFRKGKGLFKILQTHMPTQRQDDITGIIQAAPLSSDFSILAVDLYQRQGVHVFVFVNPDYLPHSPTSPNHLYQNYIIDILIPGIKDSLNIKYPWFLNIEDCIKETFPKIVTYDPSQIDYRES